MKKNKNVESNVKRLQFNVTRYLIYSIDPQVLNDLKSKDYKKFIDLIYKSKNDAIELKNLLVDAISELEKDIDYLTNLGVSLIS